VAFDFVVDDGDRIQPFALFGDAVTSCMITRGDAAGLSLLSYGVNVDFAGLLGRDDFQSRKGVADITLKRVLEEGNIRIEDVECCFSTNLFRPIALFNASICGIHRSKLCIDTLKSHAHCGNCDWMMNLVHYGQNAGFTRGKKYLVQSYAPGFFACGILKSLGDGNTAA
jgi:3-oxoacyl-[acyl-carrier-protein] synthase-3